MSDKPTEKKKLPEGWVTLPKGVKICKGGKTWIGSCPKEFYPPQTVPAPKKDKGK